MMDAGSLVAIHNNYILPITSDNNVILDDVAFDVMATWVQRGLIALTKTLGRELAPENITVNAVAPGVIDTPQLQVDADNAKVSLAEMHEEYSREIPIGRIGRADEIASAVALLARKELGAFVGQTIQVNGGSTRCRA